MSEHLINITINNRDYQVPSTTTILKACEEVSIEIPRFCYHEKLSVAGNCRMCLVEVEKSPKPVVSCAMPVSKNMVIYTSTPLVQKARESVLEFLLINHPLDCPICDQGGECDLQDEALQFGSDRGRFFETKRGVEDKDCGPIIKTIMTRCIHCTRCVRFSAEIAGQETMGSFGRGDETEIGTYVQSFIKTELSGNLVDLCPVGALTSKPYAYTARSWELRRGETIDFFDALCVDINVQTRKVTQNKFDHAIQSQNTQLGTPRLSTREEIVRILPRANGLHSDNWISDKTRYAFDALNRGRLTSWHKGAKGLKNHGLFLHYAYASLEQRQNLLLDFYDYWTGGVFLAETQLGRVVTIFDGAQDFETLALSSIMLKYFGVSDFHYSNYRLQLNNDLPNFFTLNNGFKSIELLNSLLLIGVNPRFEASLLNTNLRKQQLQRGTSYFSINPFTDLKYNHNHLGAGLRSLIGLIENRISSAKQMYTVQNAAVFIGAESLKGKNGLILQNLIRFFGKKFFAKTKSADLLATIHANITTINMAELGLDIGVRSDLHVEMIKDRQVETLFAIQPQNFNEKKWISTLGYTNTTLFATHKPAKTVFDQYLPIKSLYEKNGSTFNTEGRLRRFYKVVDAPVGLQPVENNLLMVLRTTFPDFEWVQLLKDFWFFKQTWNFDEMMEESPNSYFIDYLNFNEVAHQVTLTVFTPTIENFYMSDLISQNSLVMAETSIFVNPLTPKFITAIK